MPTRPTTTDEVREAYLRFFEQRGHLPVPSSSLIPEGDPTLLLTTAGMVQFKPYFTGQRTPPNPRLTSCQKCFRTTDIDAVGDSKHLTFFEMLGNFSIGDYFKKEAIAWAWEFVTGVLKLPPEHLWVTYYKPALSNAEGEGDDEDLEARDYWVGVTKGKLAASHIVPLGKKYNWWGPAGEEGPCGPCSEIHYSFDPAHTTIDDLTGDSPRAVEIWNLVFTQFNMDRQGRLTRLPKPNIDTGMGLERTAMVMQGKATAYDCDAFQPLLQRIAELSGRRYGQDEAADHAMRVVAEHARGVAFLIADGVLPSNEGRGYVLRRILRRAVRYGRKLGLEKPFLGEMVEAVIAKLGEQYPGMTKNKTFIAQIVAQEEAKFGETLTRGMVVLDGMVVCRKKHAAAISGLLKYGRERKPSDEQAGAILERHDVQGLTVHPLTNLQVGEQMALQPLWWRYGDFLSKIERGGSQTDIDAAATSVREWANRISAAEAFSLYATYGFPIDITQDIAKEHGLTVDMEGFQREMEAHAEVSRAGAKFGLGLAEADVLFRDMLKRDVGTITTLFTGYERLKESSRVLGMLVDGAPADTARQGQQVEVILERTPFYAEAGGQVGDSGEIRGPQGKVRVADTQKPVGELIVHRGTVAEGELRAGDTVEAEVDAERRTDVMLNHTATHLLHAALRQVLGAQVRQAGSLVAPDRLRFDFTHVGGLTRDQAAQVQRLINEKVRANLPVQRRADVPYDQALKEGAIAFFGDKYGDKVSVIHIGTPEETFSKELCGGTHVARTGEIGMLQVVSEGSIGSGVRRLEAATGRGVERYIEGQSSLIESVTKALHATPQELAGKLSSLLEEMERERKRAAALEREVARRSADELLSRVQSVDGVKLLVAQAQVSTVEALREMGDWLRDKLGSGVIVLGALIDDQPRFIAIVTKDLHAKGYHAGDIVKRVAAIAGGGGGGRPDMAQAGGKDKSKLGEALQAVPRLLKKE